MVDYASDRLAGRGAAASLRGVRPHALPLAVSHRDPAGLFAVEATITAWREDRPETRRGSPAIATLTLGAGALHDADKGTFCLEGIQLTVRVANQRLEPVRVCNPGVLSELQQDGLLDAVTSALNALNAPLPAPPENDRL